MEQDSSQLSTAGREIAHAGTKDMQIKRKRAGTTTYSFTRREKHYLSHRCKDTRGEAFFIRSEGHLGRDACLARVGHLDQAYNFAS